jgi:hypothetical protein
MAGTGDHTPTIDRIDNARGYVADDVLVISSRTNSVERDADVETARRRLARAEDHDIACMSQRAASPCPDAHVE